MKIETNRSNRIAAVVGVALVAFAVGLALTLWGSGDQLVTRLVGALGIVTGLFLLTSPSRYLFRRDARLSADLQIPAEQELRVQLRMSGATGILLGMAISVSDVRMRAAFVLCAAVVSIAGAFKVPRSLFKGGAE
jgi:hypothetical protein